MARYVQEPGEVELLKELVEATRDKRRVEGILIITDRRLVAQSAKPSALLGWLTGGWLPLRGPMSGGHLGTFEVTHQIDRADFESVESHGKQMISFHSNGVGYGHVSFAVYSMTPFEVWQQRMQQWVAGTLSAAPLPQAKLLDR